MTLKNTYLLTSIVGLMMFHNISSGAKNSESENVTTNTKNNNNMQTKRIKLKINSKSFTATLYDNETSKAFQKLLPLTIEMDELNGNEKKYDFTKTFPTDNSAPKKINNGDLMIWSGNTLVLFYKSFSTPYSYTKLGKIDNVEGLPSALGPGNVTITFEAQ